MSDTKQDTAESQMSSPRPEPRPADLMERMIAALPLGEATITPLDSPVPNVRLPYGNVLPLEGEVAWEASLTPENRNIIREIKDREGGFTDRGVDGEGDGEGDGEVTLFGVTAKTLAGASETYLGEVYNEEEASAYLRWMSEGLERADGKTPELPLMPTRTVDARADATALQLEHLEFFHDRIAPALYWDEFVAQPGFDRIEDPEVRELIASISVNAGPARAAYVLDGATHFALLQEPFDGTNPALDSESRYRSANRADYPDYTPQAVVDRYNRSLEGAAEMGVDVVSVEQVVAVGTRVYYKDLAEADPKFEKFLNGWNNRVTAHRDSVITAEEGAAAAEMPYTFVSRLGEESAELHASEHNPGAPVACVFAPVDRDVLVEGRVLREHVSGHVIHTEHEQVCETMGGMPVPRVPDARTASIDTPAATVP